MGVLQAQTSHQVPLLAQLLVEAEVTGADRFVCLVVFAHLVVLDFLFELVGVGQVEAANIFLLHEVSYLIAVAAHVAVAVFVLQVSEGVGDEGIFVSRAVFIEIDPHVFVLVHHFGAEFQLVAVFAFDERQFEVGAELEVFLVDVLKLFGQFVQFEAVVVVFVQQDVLSVYGRHVRAADVAPVGVHGHAFLLEGQVAFVRAFFTGLCVGCFPVEFQLPEEVFTAQGEVHRALAFQAGIALVGAARLGFVDHFVFIGCLVVPFVGVAVAVFPVVAVVEDTLEVNLVVGVDFPVQGQRIALAFAGDVVLAYFVFVEHNLTVFVPFVGHLHVVASCGIVLIRG